MLEWHTIKNFNPYISLEENITNGVDLPSEMKPTAFNDYRQNRIFLGKFIAQPDHLVATITNYTIEVFSGAGAAYLPEENIATDPNKICFRGEEIEGIKWASINWPEE
jgi:hypothetical protein